MGACLLLTGIVAAIITAPLFDRVFTHKLALTAKLLVPCVAVAWLSLIWAGTLVTLQRRYIHCSLLGLGFVAKPHNEAGLFVVMTIIGVSSVTMLPVGLELACEITRNADGSSAILWFTCASFRRPSMGLHLTFRPSGNLFGVMFILGKYIHIIRSRRKSTPPSTVQGALRADENANPPLNMHRALIFNGSFIMAASSLVFFIEGKQARKTLDEEKLRQALEVTNAVRLS